MIEFSALRIPTLDQDMAQKLESRLNCLAGVKHFAVVLEHSDMLVLFDENQLELRRLFQVLAQAGCPLQSIAAALVRPVDYPPEAEL